MRRIFISFFLSILLLKYASSDGDSVCKTTTELGDKTCEQLEASEDHYCTDNDAEGDNVPPCKEADACNLLTPKENVSDEEKCAGYTTHKQGNHCKEITVGSEQKCKEVPACQGATPDTISYDNCKDLWTEDSSKKCVVNDDETACKVTENCADVKKGANDNVCGLFSTDSQICVLNGEGCKVATECADVKKGANANVCGLFTGTTKCVVADDGNGCKVASECTDVKKGANANVCGLFTAGTIKCVVADNGEECEPKTICGQETYVKGTTKCRESVPDDNKVCVDTGNGCESQTPCGKVAYTDGTDCSKLPTVDPDKICRKHQTQQICEEVTKPDNEGGTGTNPGNNPSEETGTNPSEKTGTNPSEETGTNPGTRPSGETSPTQGTETDLSKDNKGMLLNLSLYTLLIYFLF